MNFWKWHWFSVLGLPHLQSFSSLTSDDEIFGFRAQIMLFVISIDMIQRQL
jgi:hypothetical protein